jgi:dTDP-4-dehydrorhamnose 3,5-epimerase
MLFTSTEIPDAFLVKPERIEDERGFFARTWCEREAAAHGLDPRIVQSSLSFNRRRGTLRGLHFQIAPHAENKLVSCSRGSIWDVVVDLRRDSPSYRRWQAFTLTDENLDAVFIPAGCAHGFITLADDSVVRYDISAFYAPAAARGARYDDPAFRITWPLAPIVISPRDLGFPPYAD